MTDLKEHLAAYAHTAWAGWMAYLFQFGRANADGTFTIEAEKVARWQRQASTAYADLSDEEKVSDRNEADAILEIISRYA